MRWVPRPSVAPLPGSAGLLLGGEERAPWRCSGCWLVPSLLPGSPGCEARQPLPPQPLRVPPLFRPVPFLSARRGTRRRRLSPLQGPAGRDGPKVPPLSPCRPLLNERPPQVNARPANSETGGRSTYIRSLASTHIGSLALHSEARGAVNARVYVDRQVPPSAALWALS